MSNYESQFARRALQLNQTNQVNSRVRNFRTVPRKERSIGYKSSYTIILLIALIGLVYQVVEVTNKYFMYETGTSVSIELKEEVEVPSLVICNRYADIIDRTKFDKKYPIFKGQKELEIRKLEELLTIREVLEFTPNIEDFLVHCQRREPNSYRTSKSNQQNCGKYMTFVKYFRGNYICYRVNILEPRTMSSRLVRNGLQSPGMIYELVLDVQKFKMVSSFRIVFHENSVFPPTSRSFDTIVNRNFNKTSLIAPTNKFALTFIEYRSALLEPPYGKCLDYRKHPDISSKSKTECFEKCLSRNTTSVLNRVQFTAFISINNSGTPMDYKVISAKDLAKDEIQSQLMNFEAFCSEKCKLEDCNQVLYVSRLIETEDTDQMSFKLYISSNPTIFTEYKAIMQLMDYVIYLSSCLGLWIGWSVMDTSAAVKLIDKGCRITKQQTGVVNN